MTTKTEALHVFEKHYDQWESNSSRMNSGYEYESTYAEMMQKVAQDILQLSVGKVPKGINSKKKLQTRFGKIELDKNHVLSKSLGTMSISSLAQETMCYMGQHLVFKEAEEVLNILTGADFNAKQIERVCHKYGDAIEQEDIHQIEVDGYQEVLTTDSDKLHYVSVDGSMYYTKEEDWKEIKLGRIYKEEDLVKVSKNRNELMTSTYVAHLGSNKDFIPKMEYYIENLTNKVFIADGAKWIWNWIDDTYPNSTQIVDYFHAKEHLCEFAKDYFKDKNNCSSWIEKQDDLMLTKGITMVIEELKELPNRTKKLEQLINYYKQNEKRMQYHLFKEKGLLN